MTGSASIDPTHALGIAAVVLAAGKGTRMRSNLPKVLHPLLAEPMINQVLRTLREAGVPPERTVVVVGHEAELVRAQVAKCGLYLTVEQKEQLGTGHAVRQASSLLEQMEKEKLGSAEQVLVLYGDGPLLRSETLLNLFTHHSATSPLVTMLTAEAHDPTGYGRIIRNPANGNFQAIVEEGDLTSEERAIREWNPGIYLFRAKWLWPSLSRLQKNPQKGEYYLTDMPAFAVEDQLPGEPLPVQTLLVSGEEVLGINDRVQLAEAGNLLRRRILEKWMLSGVTITDPTTTYISPTTILEPDCIIEPNSHLRGACRVGRNSVIGPNSILVEAQVGAACKILASMIEHAVLEDEVTVGPFSHVRPGAYLEKGVHLGNFAEVNRSRLGAGTKQGHFSYIGDATFGSNVNIGAGTVTANFDGINKNKTIVGANTKLGVDTMLVAPVKVGEDVITGAGAVVTRDVESGATVVGVPAKPLNKNS
ncbi:MAG: bifunctional UDP-N-acetylglucosamine diphosphorylase/glucosamine-1-phosphate N-acetyltransferase GlmU [Chloroflexi bacterium]|nr:bifunctional UDP-N-acetylglucosamine diphosphorylase/glucosamine-1-phosphate N-acetyltransferase GlmU [Chloroflexota bacterium]